MFDPQASRGAPLPYTGYRFWRKRRIGEAYRENDGDRGPTHGVPYEINTLGFRGDEFLEGSPLTIFAFGESDAMGSGLAFEDCWTTQAARLLAEQAALAWEDVCYMNFAEDGVSNAHIARMVLTQCDAVRPDVVLVNFADPMRFEDYANSEDGSTFAIGDWLDKGHLKRSVASLPPKHPMRKKLRDHYRRWLAYLAFCTPSNAQLDAIRNVLLVQNYLRSHDIPAIATIRNEHGLGRNNAASDPVLGPLFRQIDPSFLAPVSLESAHVQPDRATDGVHYGPRSHEALAAKLVERLQPERQRTERHCPFTSVGTGPHTSNGDSENVGPTVRAFYETLPFNVHESARHAADAVRRQGLRDTYPDLDKLLSSGRIKSVLEVGCGGGWLANTLALRYPVQVTGIDFCSTAIYRALDLAEALGTAPSVRFLHSDLFEYAPLGGGFDLVISLGVLHHTKDARRAFHHIQQLARQALYIGLYHEPGRRVFLNVFRKLLIEEGEEAAFEHYRKLDPSRAGDSKLARSWFRDQVLHPHETQHSLRETHAWMQKTPWTIRSTSINHFAPIEDLEAVFELESSFEERSRRANLDQGRFFPGFFTFLAAR